MTLGKTIQIFIPDANPRSIKIAEITSRTVQVIFMPRSKLDYAFSRKELVNVGIYFLVGDSNEGGRPLLYIGEAEECLSRLRQQNKAKDFWNVALSVVSKTRYFTKTHIKFLEWYCYSNAKEIGRYDLENTTIPSKPFVSESVMADLLDNFETIKILVSTLGYPIFDQVRVSGEKEILVCKGRDAYAKGEYTEDGLIVLTGSKCNLKETKTAGSWVIGARQKLIKNGILAQDGNILKFTSDYIFSSPSAAAATVLARRANGWTEWKYKNGKTLDEIKRRK